MTDLALTWDAEAAAADLALLGADLATEVGLKTAVIISLFSDARAREDDELPDASGDRRGWWADAWPMVDGDVLGSRLWLLERAKQLPQVLIAARQYAQEALAWMVADGVASSVAVTAEWGASGQLGLQVEIARPSADRAQFHFLWERP